MDDQSLKRKLKALLEMSRRGTEHEAEIAKKKLKDLLEKHNLELNDFDTEEAEITWFSFKTKYEKQLLFQTIFRVTNQPVSTYYSEKGKRQVGYKLTKIDAIEVGRLYSHWKSELKKEFQRTYEAFIRLNNIYGDSTSCDTSEMTKQELRELAEVMRRMSAMDASSPLHQLEG